MMQWRRILAAAAVGLSLFRPEPAAAGAATILVDDGSGAVLAASDADRLWYPASLTKMMTVYLAFEAIEAGRLDLDEKITVSKAAAAQPPTDLGVRAGAELGVETAINAAILRSANDAAVALAERIGGSEAGFVTMMNAKARALGMTRTVFRNASGLPDAGQVTTARDMALLARALRRDYPQHYHFFSARSFVYRGRRLPTINSILERYPGADGIKTGFTCGAGYNLVASVERDGRRLIGVVLGGRNRADRVEEMVRLLDDGFAAGGVPEGGQLQRAALDAAAPATGPDLPPEAQLDSGSCAYASLDGRTAGDRTAEPEPLPGWGILFGAYFSRLEANAAIRQSRSALGRDPAGARPAIVPRRSSLGLEVYAALLVGLSQQDAGRACQRLTGRDQYCQALNPEVLNNPKAVWR
jgi:D-alanyl-D-alanine carboxypeptidase